MSIERSYSGRRRTSAKIRMIRYITYVKCKVYRKQCKGWEGVSGTIVYIYIVNFNVQLLTIFHHNWSRKYYTFSRYKLQTLLPLRDTGMFNVRLYFNKRDIKVDYNSRRIRIEKGPHSTWALCLSLFFIFIILLYHQPFECKVKVRKGWFDTAHNFVFFR